MRIINPFYAARTAGRRFHPRQSSPVKVLDLFSGIGGFSLGFERAGMHTAASVKSTPIAARCCPGTGRTHRSIATSENFQQGDFNMTASATSISSAAAIPASRSASRETGAANATRVTSGLKCIDSFKKSGRDGSFAKTLLAMFNSVSTPYWATWKLVDTPLGRSLFQLAPSGRLTGGTAYGLLPTPLASDYTGRWGRKDDNLLRNYLPRRFGGSYPHPSLVETMMGFPPGWTDCAP